MIAIPLLLAFLAGAAPAADEPTVRIVHTDGTLFGILHETKDGAVLSLARPDGSELEVGACADEEVQKVPSPDGAMHVSVIERNCGATVDFASRVILAEAQSLTTLVVLEGRPQINLVWKGGKRIEVHHSKMTADQVFQPLVEVRGVAVAFIPDLGAAEPSPYLDFSSVNYGATGRAAGMPREFLLRLAGWSQEASGLHRKEWGSWTGPAPYGDDPRGRAKVIAGIEYYEKKYESAK